MDFDNTITCGDVLDAVIERFSISRQWQAFEEDWKAGRIGSKECLEAQLSLIRVRKDDLADYVRHIPIDPFFPELLEILRVRKIPCLILSDSFSFMIHTILERHSISGIPVYANELRFQEDRLVPLFPYSSSECKRCAHCKKPHLLADPEKYRIYVGDGLSDVCPSLEADLVFAKAGLRKHLQEMGMSCRLFQSLDETGPFFKSLKKNSIAEKMACHPA